MLRQVGIKIWVDGSPWIGNIALSFPYLDTEATRTIGVTPGSCGCANYTAEQLTEIVGAYYPLGWQMACHVQGDAGVDTILDVYEEALQRNPRDDHRLRLEHVGAIRRRATAARRRPRRHLQHLRRPDPLLGRRHRRRAVRSRTWIPLDASGFRGGHRHAHLAAQRSAGDARGAAAQHQRGRDPQAPSGRVLAPEERLTVEQAIRAQTIDAAWQLFSDDVIGSLEVGKYADLVVLSADPRTVPPEQIADLRGARDVSGGPPGLPRSDTALRRRPRPPARGGAADAGAVPRHHHPRVGADRRPGGLGRIRRLPRIRRRRGRALAGRRDRGRLPDAAAAAARSHPDQRHRAGGRRRAGARDAGPLPGCAHRQGEGRRAGADARRRRRPGRRGARTGPDRAGRRQRRLDRRRRPSRPPPP